MIFRQVANVHGKWLLASLALCAAQAGLAQTGDETPNRSYTPPTPETIEAPSLGDARFVALFRSWVAADTDEERSDTLGPVPQPPPSSPAPSGLAVPQVSPLYSASPPPAYIPPTSATRYGCSESGSCYGEISPDTGRPKRVYVPGYYKSNGKYVRGYYRSQ
jgi:hypothetical protein